jgi:hypothetical protein
MIDIKQELESLVNTPIDATLLPVKKGNKISIGIFTVIKDKSGYIVKEKNSAVERFRTLVAAVAYCRLGKTASKNSQEIHRLDNLIDKKTTDCDFYRNAMLESKNRDNKTCASIRLEDSRLHIKDARSKLERFIYRYGK